MAILQAEILTIVFANPENGFLVARAKVDSEPGQTTIVGCLPSVTAGEQVELTGCWKEHAKFGRQFQVDSFQKILPASEAGIRRYLGSGLIKGVGPVMAGRMVKAFGAKVLDILEEEPERLLEIDGLGRKKLESIRTSWEEQRMVRGLMLFLQTHEVPQGYAARIFRRYGNQAVDKLKENPYELAYEIAGIGFKTADTMALKLGFAPDCRERLEAALIYCLRQMSDKGHVFCPREKLLEQADFMLENMGVGPLEKALFSLADQKRVYLEPLPEADEEAVYLAYFYRMEREVASRIHALVSHAAPIAKQKVEDHLQKLEAKERISLSEEQRRAVLSACQTKFFVLTGGPGTGKTTITRMIARILRQEKMRLKLAAPTGRAAKRLSEATGFPATTIHRLLGFSPDGSFGHHEEKKLKIDALLLDEVSMLDLPLCVNLLRSLPLTCRVIFIGDADQLPSVGAGNVLGDLLESGAVASARLTQIYRQARQSLIVMNAHNINTGRFPVASEAEPPATDFFWVEQEDPERIVSIIQQLVCDRIPTVYGFSPMRQIQVLSPMHKGDLGTANLNSMLQSQLNPRGRELRKGMRSFRLGDRVLQVRNNYEKEVFNGDLGWIASFDEEESEVVVEVDGRRIRYGFDEMDELTLAYAISVHKSQGSEYPAVVLPVVTQHFIMLRRNLLYTGLTRARNLAVLIGSRKAMNIALKSFGQDRRYSRLAERIRKTFEEN